ncbi:MAG: hypothetical protein Q4C70_13920, partial [Planctomycetia bacterium]|nr:hypothetical protein [Planctomycetia bacterium]
IYDSITVESGTKWNKYGGQGDLFMTVSADGKFMCRADMDGVVRLWDVENGNVIRDFGADSGHIAAITLDGKKVIRSIGRVVYVWGAQTGQKIDSWELPGNDKGNSNNIALSIDGRYVALTYKKEEGDDRTTGIWDIRTKQCICEIPRCGVLCFSPDGTKIGSTGGVWDIATGERLYDNPDNNYSFAWSPMGNIVAFSTYGSEVYIRDAEMGDLLEKFKVPGNYIWTLSFSSDGEYLAATHGMIRVSGKLKRGRKWTNSGGEMVTDV